MRSVLARIAPSLQWLGKLGTTLPAFGAKPISASRVSNHPTLLLVVTTFNVGTNDSMIPGSGSVATQRTARAVRHRLKRTGAAPT